MPPISGTASHASVGLVLGMLLLLPLPNAPLVSVFSLEFIPLSALPVDLLEVVDDDDDVDDDVFEDPA